MQLAVSTMTVHLTGHLIGCDRFDGISGIADSMQIRVEGDPNDEEGREGRNKRGAVEKKDVEGKGERRRKGGERQVVDSGTFCLFPWLKGTISWSKTPT